MAQSLRYVLVGALALVLSAPEVSIGADVEQEVLRSKEKSAEGVREESSTYTEPGNELAKRSGFIVGGAASGIEIATALALGVVGASLISYADGGDGDSAPRTRLEDPVLDEVNSEVFGVRTTLSTQTKGKAGVGSATSIVSSTTTSSAATSSASAISSTGSM